MATDEKVMMLTLGGECPPCSIEEQEVRASELV
jgi:hypothetical protein